MKSQKKNQRFDYNDIVTEDGIGDEILHTNCCNLLPFYFVAIATYLFSKIIQKYVFYTCWFFQNYVIFEDFIIFWMIAYSYIANFAVKPGFLHIFLKKSAIMNFSWQHRCFWGNMCQFYIFPWCGKFNVFSKYSHCCTSISYIWKLMNSYADLGESSYKFCRFNLAAKGLYIIKIIKKLVRRK